MADDTSRPLALRFFRACLMLLGGVAALWLAVDLLAQFWGWLLLLVAIALVIFGVTVGYQYWRDRRW